MQLRRKTVYSPDADIRETSDGVVLLVDMPAVDPRGVDITVENDVLEIEGRAGIEAPKGHRLARAEYGVGDYKRTFTVTSRLDRDHIKAGITNGVLTITIPKAKGEQRRTIAVETA